MDAPKAQVLSEKPRNSNIVYSDLNSVIDHIELGYGVKIIHEGIVRKENKKAPLNQQNNANCKKSEYMIAYFNKNLRPSKNEPIFHKKKADVHNQEVLFSEGNRHLPNNLFNNERFRETCGKMSKGIKIEQTAQLRDFFFDDGKYGKVNLLPTIAVKPKVKPKNEQDEFMKLILHNDTSMMGFKQQDQPIILPRQSLAGKKRKS